jgi:hypothetical protein
MRQVATAETDPTTRQSPFRAIRRDGLWRVVELTTPQERELLATESAEVALDYVEELRGGLGRRRIAS